jgi:NTP pyrophosphatase (non-canonical NTP hydrolase)
MIDFGPTFAAMQHHVWEISENHGFHKGPTGNLPTEKIALIHGELSEALEELRLPNLRADEKCSNYRAVTVELADAVIRIMDLAEILSLDLAGAIEAKSAYNETRPYMHGKRF